MKIAIPLFALALSGCATGPSPVVQALVSEYDSYKAMVVSEYEAGRITKEHGNYLLSQKQAELVARARSMSPPRQPIYQPIVPVTPSRAVNCTTSTVSGYTSTHCY